MKIGILTYHHSINEGAMLQAFALQELCKEVFRGAIVEVVNYESALINRRDLGLCFPNGSLRTGAFAGLLKRRRRLKRFKAEAFALGRSRYVGDDYEKAVRFINAQGYDLIIVGSDEVWKIVEKGRPFPSVYWLDTCINSERASYAASANKTDYASLSAGRKEVIARALGSYRAIGVRDNHTMAMVQAALPQRDDVQKVVDPTLAIGRIEPKPIEEKLRSAGIDPDRPFMLLNLENPALCREAAEYARARGWQVVSVTVSSEFADANVHDLNPLEWVGVISRARFTVTQRFHGTIFAILHRVPFLSIETGSQFRKTGTSKLFGLLEDFRLTSNHLDHDPASFSADSFRGRLELASEGTSFDHVESLLITYREVARAYLGRLSAEVSGPAPSPVVAASQ